MFKHRLFDLLLSRCTTYCRTKQQQ